MGRQPNPLDEGKLASALDQLQAENARPLSTAGETLTGLAELYDRPVPEAELAWARQSLDDHHPRDGRRHRPGL